MNLRGPLVPKELSDDVFYCELQPHLARFFVTKRGAIRQDTDDDEDMEQCADNPLHTPGRGSLDGGDVSPRSQSGQYTATDEEIGHILLATVATVIASDTGVHIETYTGLVFDMVPHDPGEKQAWLGECCIL